MPILQPPLTSNTITLAGGVTTLREKMLRKASQVKKVGNQWSKPWMMTELPWQPNTTYVLHDVTVNNGGRWLAIIGGPSSIYPGGPTNTSSAGTTDGAITWMYIGENPVSTDPFVVQIPWSAGSSAVALGGQTTNGGNVYAAVATTTYIFTVSGVSVTPTIGSGYTNNSKNFLIVAVSIAGGSGTIVCTGTGAPTSTGTLTKAFGTGDATVTFSGESAATTTAGSGGPTGTGTLILDNGYVWSFYGKLAANPYANSIPSVTYESSPSLTNLFTTSASQSFNCLQAYPIGTGASYVNGELVTVAVGNGTKVTDIILQMGGVVNGVPTTCTIYQAGQYTTLQSNHSYWSQGSSNKSGTGETFILGFNEAGWCKLTGVVPGSNTATYYGSGFTYVPSVGSAGVMQHWKEEFISESDVIEFPFVLQGNYTLTIDDVMYSPGVNSNIFSGHTYAKLDFTQAGGAKFRKYKISATTATNLPGVLIQGNRSIFKPSEQDRIKCAYVNDSLGAGSAYGPMLSGNSLTLRLGEELDWDITDYSQGGTGYANRGATPGAGSDNYASRIAQVLFGNPDVVLSMGSSNDFSSTTAQVTAAVMSFCQQLRASGFIGPIGVFGIWPYNNANVASYELAIQQGVINFKDPLGRTTFMPLYNDPFFPVVVGAWDNNPAPSGLSNSAYNTANALIGGDSLHPNDNGTQKLAVYQANLIMGSMISTLNM